MLAQNSFKKNDIVYKLNSISKSNEWDTDQTVIPCEILKLSKEDKLKSWTEKVTSKKKIHQVMKGHPSSTYPADVAFITYLNSNNEISEHWVYLDTLKKTAHEFLNLIPMPWEK